MLARSSLLAISLVLALGMGGVLVACQSSIRSKTKSEATMASAMASTLPAAASFESKPVASVEALGSKLARADSGPQSVAFAYGRLCAIWRDGSLRCIERAAGAGSSLRVVLHLTSPVQGLLASRNSLCLRTAADGMSFHSFGESVPSLCRAGFPGAAEWVSLAEDAQSLCGVRADGELWCFDAPSPAQTEREWLADLPKKRWLDDAAAVTAGTTGFFCGRKRNGSVWCWGKNDRGALGDGSFRDRSAPVRTRLSLPVLQVAAGNAHVCALLEDHSVSCWGEHVFGQLGIGHLPPSGDGDGTAVRLNPTRYDTPQRVRLDEPSEHIAASADATCALTRSGRLWCWGANREGLLLGSGNQPGVAEPTLVQVLRPLRLIVSAEGTFCALDRERRTWCWGYAGGLFIDHQREPVEVSWD